MAESSGMKLINFTDETTTISTVTLYCTVYKVVAVTQMYSMGTLVANVDVCVRVCRSSSTNFVWRESDSYTAHMV
jgi:hypothetical protein